MSRQNEHIVDRRISPWDEMLVEGGEDFYFAVGASALECIDAALHAARKPAASVRQILDLPCGHGRVLRYLKVAFPQAEITACDLLRDGVDFCASTFGAIPAYSYEDPMRIPLRSGSFDLIWVGSLLTHLDQELWASFCNVFRDLLRCGGILVMSTHGREAYRQMANGEAAWCGLPDELSTAVLAQYERIGFGYADYPGSQRFGNSLSKPEWVIEQLSRLSELRIVFFCEKAWVEHHDVFACVRDPLHPGVFSADQVTSKQMIRSQ